MRQLSLVRTRLLVLSLVLLPGILGTPAQAQNNTFGDVIPLPGHIDEVILDEARGLVYAANFSAGRVEVVSSATNKRVSSFLTSTRPTAITSAAMSVDGRFLVVTEVPVAGLPGLTVINLNDPGDRRHFPTTQQPLGLAFGSHGKALVVNKTSLQLFDPEDGSLTLLFDYSAPPPPDVVLPVGIPTFPREVIRTNLVATRDGKWIFGVATVEGRDDGFVFSHRAGEPRGSTRIRVISTLVKPPAFDQVSAAKDGSYFMAGQLLFNTALRVIADSPEAPEDPTEDDFPFGGHVIDSEIDTVFASFNPEIEGDLPGQESTGILNVMDADNLYVRRRIRIPERASGRFVTDSKGESLYAVGQSGLLHIPLSQLSAAPIVEVHPEDRSLLFEFNFCAREPISQTLRVESPDGGPAQVTLSLPEGSGGVLFEPDQFTTPQDVRVTVDPEIFGSVQGTGVIEVQFETDSVNVPPTTKIIANIRDVDQKGNAFPVAGELVDVLSDQVRNRFYVLDQSTFQVLIFDSNTFRLLGTIRTGNSPTWMSFDDKHHFLFVANSRGENITVINLDTLRKEGTVFLPFETLQFGHYPMSLAADNASVLISTKIPERVEIENEGELGQIVVMTVPFFGISKPSTLGIFVNGIDPLTALVSAPNLSGVFMAFSDGRTALWESLSRRVILAREDYMGEGLKGAIGAGPDFFLVDNHVLNASMVPQLDLPDVAASQESSGFALLSDGRVVRSIRPSDGVDSGVLQQFNSADFTQISNPARMVDTPPPARDPEVFPFTRTLAALPDGRLVSLGTAGVMEFPKDYASGLDTPRIAAMVNAASFTTDIAAGGLVTFFGENLSTQTASASGTPLPKVLGGSCVTVNGAGLPLLFVSPTQINAQLPFNAAGTANTIVRNAGGISDIFVSDVQQAAPAMFNVRGPNESLVPAIFRLDDNKLVTLSTPLRPNDRAALFLTGLGPVTPVAIEGFPAAETPLSETVEEPVVILGEVPAIVEFSGLAPGFVGVNQVNVLLPGDVPRGLQVPLTVFSGTTATTVQVRIVED